MNVLSMHEVKSVRISPVVTSTVNIGCSADGHRYSLQTIDIEGSDGILLKIQLFLKAESQSPIIIEGEDAA